jgi:hypothetical protein
LRRFGLEEAPAPARSPSTAVDARKKVRRALQQLERTLSLCGTRRSRSTRLRGAKRAPDEIPMADA